MHTFPNGAPPLPIGYWTGFRNGLMNFASFLCLDRIEVNSGIRYEGF
jgi:hypothetical protein